MTVPACLTPTQFDALIRPISSDRVQQTQGQSHVEAWDIRRYLIRIFGFGGYDTETLECTCIERIVNEPGTIQYSNGGSNNRTVYTTVYRAQVRLTVKAPNGTPVARYEDGATGDAVNQPSLGDAHDMAMKTALSQALKRCATNLGDQFGLSLYNNGSRAGVVQRSLVAPGMDAGDLTGTDDQVMGGELDEQPQAVQDAAPARQEQQCPTQRPQQRQAAPAQRPVPAPAPERDDQPRGQPQPDTLREFVRLILQCRDPQVLARMRDGLGGRRANTVATQEIPVPIGEAAVRIGLIKPRTPVTLHQFIDACIAHIEQQGGMTLADAASVGAAA
jgi:hypothetical protein